MAYAAPAELTASRQRAKYKGQGTSISLSLPEGRASILLLPGPFNMMAPVA